MDVRAPASKQTVREGLNFFFFNPDIKIKSHGLINLEFLKKHFWGGVNEYFRYNGL